MALTATPAPCRVQWSKKGNDEDQFKPIDADAKEYRGTTNYLPHPKLVVKDKNLLENNCFQIEVSNFVGSTVAIVAGKNIFIFYFIYDQYFGWIHIKLVNKVYRLFKKNVFFWIY